MFIAWITRTLKRIWNYIAPSVERYARAGLDDFLKANIDEAFQLILELRQLHGGASLHAFWSEAFERLKTRNRAVADTWIARLLVDAYEHLKASELRQPTP